MNNKKTNKNHTLNNNKCKTCRGLASLDDPNSRGITLIALTITIIVMLILVGVAVTLALNGKLFDTAQEASKQTELETDRELLTGAVLGALAPNGVTVDFEKLDKNLPNGFTGSNGKYTSPNKNTFTVDIKGNIVPEKQESEEPKVDDIKIPEDFTHKEGATIEEGIVVADKAGNEYVWIPVTKDEEGNPTEPYKESNGKLATTKGEVEVQLQRNNFGSGQMIASARMPGQLYKENTKENHVDKNAIAEDIEAFKKSVAKNGGYFLGRYEAGIDGETIVIKKGQTVYKEEKQPKASELCRNIDTQKGYKEITSDLTNSYAWDTAIVFIQACGKEDNSANYATQIGISTTQTIESKTGEAKLSSTQKEDKQCNIYDMAGSKWEWTTETVNTEEPYVFRGGEYGDAFTSTRSRNNDGAPVITTYEFSFRPILYWNS